MKFLIFFITYFSFSYLYLSQNSNTTAKKKYALHSNRLLKLKKTPYKNNDPTENQSLKNSQSPQHTPKENNSFSFSHIKTEEPLQKNSKKISRELSAKSIRSHYSLRSQRTTTSQSSSNIQYSIYKLNKAFDDENFQDVEHNKIDIKNFQGKLQNLMRILMHIHQKKYFYFLREMLLVQEIKIPLEQLEKKRDIYEKMKTYLKKKKTILKQFEETANTLFRHCIKMTNKTATIFSNRVISLQKEVPYEYENMYEAQEKKINHNFKVFYHNFYDLTLHHLIFTSTALGEMQNILQMFQKNNEDDEKINSMHINFAESRLKTINIFSTFQKTNFKEMAVIFQKISELYPFKEKYLV